MPSVKKGESEKDYVSRCIPVVLNEGTAKDQKQAAAICYSMYKQHHNRAKSLSLSKEDSQAIAIAESPTEFWKELIHVGDFSHAKDGYEFSVDTNQLQHWQTSGNMMLSLGIDVPVPIEHTQDPEKRRGKVVDYDIRNNRDNIPALYARIKFNDAEQAKQLSQCGVSIFVPEEISDKYGRKFPGAIEHVAITDYPVINGLEGFQAIALSKVRPMASQPMALAGFDPNQARGKGGKWVNEGGGDFSGETTADIERDLATRKDIGEDSTLTRAMESELLKRGKGGLTHRPTSGVSSAEKYDFRNETTADIEHDLKTRKDVGEDSIMTRALQREIDNRSSGYTAEQQRKRYHDVPGGQGYNSAHKKHPLHEPITSTGYKYSHTTPITRMGGEQYLHHTYRHPTADHAVGVDEGSMKWEAHKGGSGQYHRGSGAESLKKYLNKKVKQKQLSNVDDDIETANDIQTLYFPLALATSNMQNPPQPSQSVQQTQTQQQLPAKATLQDIAKLLGVSEKITDTQELMNAIYAAVQQSGSGGAKGGDAAAAASDGASGANDKAVNGEVPPNTDNSQTPPQVPGQSPQVPGQPPAMQPQAGKIVGHIVKASKTEPVQLSKGIIGQLRDARKVQIDRLQEQHKITPAVAKRLTERYCTDAAIQLSNTDAGDGFSDIIADYNANAPIASGSKTPPQGKALELSKGDDTDENNPLLKDANGRCKNTVALRR